MERGFELLLQNTQADSADIFTCVVLHCHGQQEMRGKCMKDVTTLSSHLGYIHLQLYSMRSF